MQKITFEELNEQLKHKRKSVDDLISFIKNRYQNEPNYSLLLGAGASVSSGIKSASELIEMWSKEICESNAKRGDVSDTKEDFFKKESWYDARNEYSSLFEKQYDLPRQRRMFIEKIVDGKMPSIGYSYLLKLIEKSYFRTVFTTNFDDLLNQSFYSHSSERPIVCAHDSSINSISVTSKRPKIIKLHGDYLFDDIKNTLKETESLEGNIKDKFIEFAKDYGLIVVGYAGNDRSVMDVLSYLLKHDGYLDNGIYWCIREGDSVSNELKKLLWLDKVYYVPIKGFDQLFAEINAKISDRPSLPYETRLSLNLSDISKEIDYNKKQFHDCDYIIEDLKRSEEALRASTIANALKEISSENNTDDIPPEESLILSRIKELVIQERFGEALEEIEKSYRTELKTNTRIEILRDKAVCFRSGKFKNLKEAIKTYKERIELMKATKKGGIMSDYVTIINLSASRNDKLKEIENALKEDPYNSDVYRLKGDILSASYKTDLHSVTEKDVIMSYLRSIELNPSIENSAHFNLIDFLLENGLNESQENKPIIDEILSDCEKQDPFSTELVEVYVSLKLKCKDPINTIVSFITEKKQKNTLNYRNYYYDIQILRVYEKEGTLDELKKQIQFIEDEYPDREYFNIEKASLIFKKFRNLHLAIETLTSSKFSNKRLQKISEMKLLSLYLNENKTYQGEIDRIIKNNSDDDSFKELIIGNHIFNNRFKEADEIIESQNYDDDIPYFMKKSFLLLKEKQYKNVCDLLKDVNERTYFKDNTLVINYELARALQKDSSYKTKKKRLYQITEKSEDTDHKAAAYSILFMEDPTNKDHKNNCIKILKELICKNYSNWYEFKEFPVFKDIDFNTLKLEPIDIDNLVGNNVIPFNQKQAI